MNMPHTSEDAPASLLSYTGETGKIYSIAIINSILCILTLFIYRPWARTRMRRYVYGKLTFSGEALSYTGTGKELFKGTLKVFFLLFLFFFVLGLVELGSAIATGDPEKMETPQIIAFLTSLLSYVAIIYLGYFGQFSGRRYRLSRLRWRGIRGGMKGSAKDYALAGVKYMLLNIITLFLLKPKFDLVLRKKLVDCIYLGKQKCDFQIPEDTKPLFRSHYITLLLAIPTLGFSRLWYQAKLKNTYMQHMQAGSLHFQGTHSGKRLLSLLFGNILLAITFIGFPYALQRYIRYATTHNLILGSVEGTALLQGADTGIASGDVIEEFYDDGVDFDMGML